VLAYQDINCRAALFLSPACKQIGVMYHAKAAMALGMPAARHLRRQQWPQLAASHWLPHPLDGGA